MNFKKSLLVGCLTTLLGIGAAVGLGAEKEPAREARATTYSVVGISSWDPTDTTLDMSDSDGDGWYTVNYSFPANSDKLFKIVKDHAWGGDVGGDNCFYKPSTTENSVWTDGDGNCGFWTKTAATFKICFRPTDSMIAIVPTSATLPTEYKTFYLNQNEAWSDWANPRINYWLNGYGVVWSHSPTMENCGEKLTKNDVTGNLYKTSIPSTGVTGLLIGKSNLDDGKTENLDVSSGNINIAHFYNDGSDKLYGYHVDESDNGAFLRGDWTDGWSVSGQIAMTSSSQDGPYSKTGINLGAGSAVKALYITNHIVEHWCQFNSVSTNDEERYPVITVDDGQGGYNAGVKSSGTYNLTVTKNNDKWDYAFVGTANADLDAAVTFANGFVQAMNDNCPATSQSGSASKVATAWGAQITAFAGLSEDVTYYLLDKDSKITAITAMFSSYDWIYGHYSNVRALQGADFLERTPAVVLSPTVNPLIEGLTGDRSTDATIIVLVAVAAVSIAGVGAFFFIKRRKEDR